MPWTSVEAAREAVRLATPGQRRAAAAWIAAYAARDEQLTAAYIAGMLTILTAYPPPLPRPRRIAQDAPGPQGASTPRPTTVPPQEPPAQPVPTPFQDEPETEVEPSRPGSISPPGSLEEVEALCRVEGYTAIDLEKPAFPGAGQFSLEHEPGTIWLWFPKSPPAPTRARLKRLGFKGRYEGTRTDRRGRVRPNFAGWRWAV